MEITALVIGIIALNKIKRTYTKGKGLAISAIVIGGMFVVLIMLLPYFPLF